MSLHQHPYVIISNSPLNPVIKPLFQAPRSFLHPILAAMSQAHQLVVVVNSASMLCHCRNATQLNSSCLGCIASLHPLGWPITSLKCCPRAQCSRQALTARWIPLVCPNHPFRYEPLLQQPDTILAFAGIYELQLPIKMWVFQDSLSQPIFTRVYWMSATINWPWPDSRTAEAALHSSP